MTDPFAAVPRPSRRTDAPHTRPCSRRPRSATCPSSRPTRSSTPRPNPPRGTDVQVEAGGELGTKISKPETHTSELIGIAAAMLVLVLVFGTVTAMVLPIAAAIVGVLGGLSLISLLGHLVAVPDVAPTVRDGHEMTEQRDEAQPAQHADDRGGDGEDHRGHGPEDEDEDEHRGGDADELARVGLGLGDLRAELTARLDLHVRAPRRVRPRRRGWRRPARRTCRRARTTGARSRMRCVRPPDARGPSANGSVTLATSSSRESDLRD